MWKSLVSRVNAQKKKVMTMFIRKRYERPHDVIERNIWKRSERSHDLIEDDKRKRTECEPDVIEEDEELFHSVIKIPLDYLESAQITIESIYGATTIENIRIHSHHSDVAVKYAYVSFESYEVASRALTIKHFWPNGELVVITKEPELSPEACQASHFDVLNTECLLHLYKYLHPVDIAKASEAFQCLSQFATENIYHQYAILDLYLKGYQYDFNELKCVFKHFGEFVTRCVISSDQLKNPTINHVRAIMRYCPNLAHMTLNNITFGPNDLELLCKEPLRATTALFVACRSSMDNWSALWTKWHCLRSLTFCHQSSRLIGPHFLDGLTNLETLSFNECFDIDDKTIINVLEQNRTTMTTCEILCRGRNTNVYHQLYEIAPKLGNLTVHVDDPAQISQLHKLNHLKKLKLIVVMDTPYTSWSSNIESIKTLVELDVNISAARLIEMSAKMPTLQVLRICFPHSGYLDIFEIVSNLPNLKKLCLIDCPSKWDDVDTIQILERNSSIEEIVLINCNYGCTAIPLLVDALTKQANLMDFPRPKVRVRVYEKYKVHMDFDHQLVNIEFKPLYRRFRNKDGWLFLRKPNYSGDCAGDPNDWNGRILRPKPYPH